jgi:hypothetical protein
VDFKLENGLVSLHSLKSMGLGSIIFKEWRVTWTFLLYINANNYAAGRQYPFKREVFLFFIPGNVVHMHAARVLRINKIRFVVGIYIKINTELYITKDTIL